MKLPIQISSMNKIFALLLFLIYYTVTNVEEMKANPVEYAEEKMNVKCLVPMIQMNKYNNYGSGRSTTNIGEG